MYRKTDWTVLQRYVEEKFYFIPSVKKSEPKTLMEAKVKNVAGKNPVCFTAVINQSLYFSLAFLFEFTKQQESLAKAEACSASCQFLKDIIHNLASL